MTEVSCTVEAYAKINLFLDITGRREDGYHLLNTVMQQISLADTLTITVSGQGKEIALTADHSDFPCDAHNLICRAAHAFFTYTGEFRNLTVNVKKRIPIQAGLGGGSADCAATLHALNRLSGNPLTMDELCTLGVTLGADVPFCLRGGTMRAEGIGERLTPLPAMPDCTILVARGSETVSTPEAYRALDLRYHGFAERVPRQDSFTEICRALACASMQGVAGGLYNIFENIIFERYPALYERLALMLRCGALGARMSGSGTAVFGIFADGDTARRAMEAMLASGVGVSAWLCRPIACI